MTAWRKRALSNSERAKLLLLAQPTLDRIRAALAKPIIYLDYDYDLGPSILFPELSSIKSCTMALMISAGAKADAGDLSGAESDIECGLKLENALHATPLFIHALVEISIRQYLERGIEDVAAKLVTTGKGMAQFADFVARFPQTIDLGSEIHGEFYISLAIARNLPRMGGMSALKQLSSDTADGSGPPYPSGSKLVRTGLPTDPAIRAQFQPVLLQYLAIDAIVKDPATDLDTKVERLDRLEAKLENSNKVDNILALIVMPNVGSFAKNCRKLDANAALEKSFMLVMNYRAQHGHFPKTLKEAKAMVNDPYYDRPFSYATSRDTCSVWTPGPVFETMDPDTGGKKTVAREIRMGYPPGK